MNESTARSPWWSHLLFVAVGLGLWFWTRGMMRDLQRYFDGQTKPHEFGIGSFNRVPSGPRLFCLRFKI